MSPPAPRAGPPDPAAEGWQKNVWALCLCVFDRGLALMIPLPVAHMPGLERARRRRA